MDWIKCSDKLPPPYVVVDTKIVENGISRMEQALKLGESSNLWFVPDGSVCVYYCPTHWRSLSYEAELARLGDLQRAFCVAKEAAEENIAAIEQEIIEFKARVSP